MEKKLNILEVEIDGITAKAAMKAAVGYMQSETLSTIEIVTMDMLIQGQENPEWRALTKEVDLLLPGDWEIFEVASIDDKTLLKDVTNHVFLSMFLRYLQRNKKQIFLLADTAEKMEELKQVLVDAVRGNLLIGGAGVLEPDGRVEELINEINGAEIDCIISVLPSPFQEEFIGKNSALLSARLWFGGGNAILQQNGGRTGRVRHFLLKKFFCHQVELQKKEARAAIASAYGGVLNPEP